MFGDNSQRQRSSSGAAASFEATTKPILRSNCGSGSAASANGQKQSCNPAPVCVCVCMCVWVSAGRKWCMCVSRTTICGASCALFVARNSCTPRAEVRRTASQFGSRSASSWTRRRCTGRDSGKWRRERTRELQKLFHFRFGDAAAEVLLSPYRAAPPVLLKERFLGSKT